MPLWYTEAGLSTAVHSIVQGLQLHSKKVLNVYADIVGELEAVTAYVIYSSDEIPVMAEGFS